jgi:LAO/AO transport system kinase
VTGPKPASLHITDLVEKALDGRKGALSRLVGLFEDQRPSALAHRADVIAALEVADVAPDAAVLGITGTPGSGKSSLVARLTAAMLEDDPALSIGVVAVDPSSHLSGGSLLGDRTRLRPSADSARLFFRSQASATELGGLGPSSFQVCRLMAYLFDLVLVETVGVGQSEADVRHLADQVYLVLAPLGGDEVQFLKAGIIEVPHAFVLNKCDEPSAMQSFNHLQNSLWLARPFDEAPVPIYRTSAKTGEGVDELGAAMRAAVDADHPGIAGREPYFFGRWVKDEWGRVGVSHLDSHLGGAEGWLTACGTFEAAQNDFTASLRATLEVRSD